jgi:hypothetical protein
MDDINGQDGERRVDDRAEKGGGAEEMEDKIRFGANTSHCPSIIQ